MDTGNYMANQMDSLIQNGMQEMDDFINDLNSRIELFINQNNYTWTVEEIVTEYIKKYSKGIYVSFTCKNVIETFKDDLFKSTGISYK